MTAENQAGGAGTVSEQELRQATDRVTHLFGEGGVVPFLYAGHFAPDDPRATPRIDTIAWTGNAPYHPFTGVPLVQIQINGDDRLLWAAHDRVACTRRECPVCEGVWETYTALIGDAAEGGAISGLLTTTNGPLIIDAKDLPPDETTNEN